MKTRRGISMLLCAVALLIPVSGMSQDDGGGKKKPVKTEQTSDAESKRKEEARRQQQEAEARRQQQEAEARRKREEEARRQQQEAEAKRQKEAREAAIRNLVDNMVFIEGGSFMMGSDDSDSYSSETPVHSEIVGSFRIGKYEVTQKEWQAVMGSNPSRVKGDNLPVENVSWDDCQEFIRKLNAITGKNFRLPTEAEWEYAARGGNRSRGYKYSGSNDLNSVGWCNDNSGEKTHAVGTRSANELGLYDMSGNVWEWCSDGWRSNYSLPRNNSNRVNRGGSWFCPASDCRVTNRYSDAPGDRLGDLGLRLAL